MKKRDFIRNLGLLTLGTPILPFNTSGFSRNLLTKTAEESDDIFWKRIRLDYTLKKEYINLENGWYNFIPNPTLEKYISHVKRINIEASYYMRTIQYEDKDRIKSRLADLVKCSFEELIITRNTTESLDTIISGYPWSADDEAIMAEQEYGSILEMFNQVSKRHGIKNRLVSIPIHPKSDDEIVELYKSEITSSTKMILVSHMINITGQILPIKKITEMAHEYDVEVLVDGAHCVGHIDVNIGDLKCDYYASSLHKWLSAPLGAGILFVQKKKITKIWPLFGAHIKNQNDIAKLNHTGTHPVHTDLAIGDAIDYYEMLGPRRKEERLRFLQRYWIDQVKNIENIVINTPYHQERSCAIANVGVVGISPENLAKRLFNEFNIFTVAINYSGVQGCRITPNVFNTTEDLDALVNALIHISKNRN